MSSIFIQAVGQPFVIANSAVYMAFTDVAWLSASELGLVCYSGKAHSIAYTQIELRRSRDNGRSWTNGKVIVNPQTELDVRDPHLTRLKDGTLLVNYFLFRDKTDGIRSKVITSTNGGKTWTPPVTIETPLTWNATSGKIFEAGDAVLLMPIYGKKPGTNKDEAGVVESRDGGATWTGYRTLAASPTHDVSEMEFARLGDGTLVALIRVDQSRTGLRTVSTDNGKTWSVPESCPVGHAPGLLVDESLLLVNHRGPPADANAVDYAGRATTISVSTDGGKTFAASLAIGPAAGADCAYGGIVKLPKGAAAQYFTSFYAPSAKEVSVFGQFFNVAGA